MTDPGMRGSFLPNWVPRTPIMPMRPDLERVSYQELYDRCLAELTDLAVVESVVSDEQDQPDPDPDAHEANGEHQRHAYNVQHR